MMGHAYVFKGDAAKSLVRALGLEGRKVRRIELVFDVDQPVTATVYEYALMENHAALCEVLELGDWHPRETNDARPEPTLPNPNVDIRTGRPVT